MSASATIICYSGHSYGPHIMWCITLAGRVFLVRFATTPGWRRRAGIITMNGLRVVVEQHPLQKRKENHEQ
jgi:hypothetical protein